MTSPVQLMVLLSAVVLASAVETPVVTWDVIPGVGQYAVNAKPLNWTEALVACQAGGGSMAVINSAQEAAVLKQLLDKYQLISTHVGFHDMIDEGTYTSIEGPVIYASDTLWATGAPKGGILRNCGLLTPEGITDADCAERRQTICELSISADYQLIADLGYYKHHTEPRTWAEAWEICQAEGTRLLIATSEAELAALQRYPVDGAVWVGVHRMFGIKQFVTVNNEPLAKTGYQKWYKPAHPNSDAYPSVALNVGPLPGVGLETFTASTVNQFICKKDLHP